MKIRFTDLPKQNIKDGYCIPESVLLYLKEMYSDKDIQFSILHYFICYLSDIKKSRLLEEYKTDKNEIKVSLNGLSNIVLSYNEKKNDYIVDVFSVFIGEHVDKLQIIEEFIEEFQDCPKTYKDYGTLIEHLSRQKKDNEEIIELDIIDDPVDNKAFIKELRKEEISPTNFSSIERLFNKFFGDKKDTIDTQNSVIYTSPEYEWEDTSLRFKKPDGTWGKWVDLKGSTGKSGGGSKGMNREQVNSLIRDVVPDGYPTDFIISTHGLITYVEYIDYEV